MKKELTKERVAKWLERRFFLRIHMSLECPSRHRIAG